MSPPTSFRPVKTSRTGKEQWYRISVRNAVWDVWGRYLKGVAKILEKSMHVWQGLRDTVDGWNPAPPGMYETLWIMGYLPYQLVQDFFHQQYQYYIPSVTVSHCRHLILFQGNRRFLMLFPCRRRSISGAFMNLSQLLSPAKPHFKDFAKTNFRDETKSWLFRGFVGDEILPSYVGSIINHEVRISIKQPGLNVAYVCGSNLVLLYP